MTCSSVGPNGRGPPPWTTNSYAITPWLASLRRLDAFGANVIVLGQGPAMRDRTYLRLTIQAYAGVVDAVRRALEGGLFKADEIVAAVDVDAIGKQYPKGQTGRARRLPDCAAPRGHRHLRRPVLLAHVLKQGIVMTIVAVAIAACWLPAWRASRLDPNTVLRSD